MILLNAGIATILFATVPNALAQATPNEKQLAPLLAEMMTAANSHDAERFMNAYQNSAELAVTFDDTTIVGWRPLLDQQRKWWNDGKATAVFKEEAPTKFLTISETAVATIQSIAVRASAAADAPKVAKLTVTSIWKKLPEGWRIVIGHESMTH